MWIGVIETVFCNFSPLFLSLVMGPYMLVEPDRVRGHIRLLHACVDQRRAQGEGVLCSAHNVLHTHSLHAQVNMGITTLLAMAILLLMVSDSMPTTSSFIPLMGECEGTTCAELLCS